MKVLCINGVKEGAPNQLGLNPCSEENQIFEGEIYTVINEGTLNGYVYPYGQYYILAERPSNIGYGVYCFIPVSNIDETELIKKGELVEIQQNDRIKNEH